MNYKFKDIKKIINKNYEVVGNPKVVNFNKVLPIEEADENTLVWIKPGSSNNEELLLKTRSKIIISDFNVHLPVKLSKIKCLIKTENPKLTLIKILNVFFARQYDYSIHPTAVIHPEAKIHSNVYIGPRSVIGNCEIGENTRIEGNVFIYDDTIIKRNVIIQAGAVIGSDGFGHARNKNNVLEHFPHIGRVIIDDDVHIGSNCSIIRGVLGKTSIGKGTKINSLSYIAHNVMVGENNLISVSVLINGSAKIGNNNFIGTGANIRNKVKIGCNTTIGMGSVVISDVLDSTTVVGNPAKELKNRSTKSLF